MELQRRETPMDETTHPDRVDHALIASGRDLEPDLERLAGLLRERPAAYFAQDSTSPPLPSPGKPPPPCTGDSPYASFIARHRFTPEERAVLLLALSPHLRPQLLDVLWMRNQATQRGFAEF